MTTESAPDAPPQKKHEQGRALTTGGIRSLAPQNFAEAEHIAQILGKSDIVPKEMIGKPANILLAIMYGSEIGLSPAQALQNVMVVNGRPTLWGDAVMGKVLASGFLEDFEEIWDEKARKFTYRVKRKHHRWIERSFSMEDAKKAGLDRKAGPWQQYTNRMLFHRARSWALRDGFADVLKGIRYYEEERDIIDMEKTEGPDGSYAMPGRASDGPPKAAETPKDPPPAAAPAPQEGEVVDAEVTEDDNFDERVKVTGTGKTEVKGETVYVIRTSGKHEKLLTKMESLFKLAKSVKETDRELLVDYEEKGKEIWLIQAQGVDPKK